MVWHRFLGAQPAGKGPMVPSSLSRWTRKRRSSNNRI